MEQVKAAVSTMVSGFSACIAWVSFLDAKDMAGFIAAIIACLSGIFAIRYYHYATLEKKASIKSKKVK
jgi:hypothetical protein